MRAEIRKNKTRLVVIVLLHPYTLLLHEFGLFGLNFLNGKIKAFKRSCFDRLHANAGWRDLLVSRALSSVKAAFFEHGQGTLSLLNFVCQTAEHLLLEDATKLRSHRHGKRIQNVSFNCHFALAQSSHLKELVEQPAVHFAEVQLEHLHVFLLGGVEQQMLETCVQLYVVLPGESGILEHFLLLRRGPI